MAKFDIPTHKSQSGVGAKRAYREAFGEPWPHTDDDLRMLGRWFKERLPEGPQCPAFVTLMREHSGVKSQLSCN